MITPQKQSEDRSRQRYGKVQYDLTPGINELKAYYKVAKVCEQAGIRKALQILGECKEKR